MTIYRIFDVSSVMAILAFEPLGPWLMTAVSQGVCDRRLFQEAREWGLRQRPDGVQIVNLQDVKRTWNQRGQCIRTT